MKFKWLSNVSGGFTCTMPGNVLLVVSPDKTRGFKPVAVRGTTWRAQVSQWAEASRTLSRFGRDEYAVQHGTKIRAMRAAESIYLDAINQSTAI